MRGWQILPIGLVAAIVILLPLGALTDTGVEYEFREALGLETKGCRPTTNVSSPWQAGPSLPFDLDEPRATTLDGDVYIVGGTTGITERPDGDLLLDSSDRVLRFAPDAETYIELAPMPQPLNHIGLVGYDHDLYVLGGYGRNLDRATRKTFYRYEPDRDRWTRLPDMPEPRSAMAAAVVGDRLIAAGGARDTVPSSHTFAFDFKTQRWSRLVDMPDRREHVGAVSLDGHLYVLGGRTSRSFAVRDASRYDVKRRRWERLPPLRVPTGGPAAVTSEGSVLVIGGGNDGAGTVTGAVQKWDPRDPDKWKRLDDMRLPRHGHAAAVADGKIWVFGGSPCAYFAATDDVEWLAAPGFAAAAD
ncbi:MAG: kelch repeat-containing protein [Solirubrobacterales bacterium]